jgi:hypothetical protein
VGVGEEWRRNKRRDGNEEKGAVEEEWYVPMLGSCFALG